MSNKKTSKNSLKTVKPSNKKSLFVPKNPPLPTLETAKLPDWVALVLYELVNTPTIPVVQINSLPKLEASLGFACSSLQDELEDYSKKDQYTIHIRGGQERALLDEYVRTYIDDRLPTQHYKTFEKSLAATIQFLKDAEQNKGYQFGLDGLDKPPADVRFYSDLVYLQQKGMIELENPPILRIDSGGYVAEVKVKLKVPAEDIATQLLPPEPDCQYLGLHCFVNQKKFVYNGKEYTVRSMESKWVKLLRHMMGHKTRFPWTKAVAILEIKKKFDDANGKKALENIIYNSVNGHLNKWNFPQELGFTAKHIVWQDVK